jgi:hypothetical protein
MPAGDEYGIDFGGVPWMMPPFVVNEDKLNTDDIAGWLRNYGWNFNDTINAGRPTDWSQGGGGGVGPIPVVPPDSGIIGSRNPDGTLINNSILPPPRPGYDPNVGIIDPNASIGGPGQIGIGIPGVIGIGLGGIVTGGLIGGGGGGGGSAGASQGGGSIVPPVLIGGNDQPGGMIIPGALPPQDPKMGPTAPMEQPQNPIVPGPLPPQDPRMGPVAQQETNPDTIVPPFLKPKVTEPPQQQPTIAPSTFFPTTNQLPGPGAGGSGGSNPTNPNPTVPTTTPTNIMDRNYYREGSQSVSDLQRLFPQMMGLYGQASGAYGQADYQNYANLLGQMGGSNNQMTQFANQQTREANQALRTGNLADVGNLGQMALGYKQATNQELYGNMAGLDAAAAAGVGPNQGQNFLSKLLGQGGVGPSSTQLSLEQQAADRLAQGGRLSAGDERMAQQSAREAWAARGRLDDTGAVASEALNRDALMRQRRDENNLFAQGVDQTGFNQRGTAQQLNAGMATTLGNMDYARQQQAFNQQIGATQARTQNAFDPFGVILGAQYGQQTNNAGSNQALFGQTTGFSSGALGNQYVQNAYNPYNNYSNDVYGSNFNAANARSIAASNNAAAAAGARDQMNGQLIGGLLNFAGSNWNTWFPRT